MPTYVPGSISLFYFPVALSQQRCATDIDRVYLRSQVRSGKVNISSNKSYKLRASGLSPFVGACLELNPCCDGAHVRFVCYSAIKNTVRLSMFAAVDVFSLMMCAPAPYSCRLHLPCKWNCLICPIWMPLDDGELHFSKALESVHKDSEPCFGVLKGRLRTLKLPIMFQDSKIIDSMFLTCCILHNMLHAHGGIEALEEGVDWAGKDGRHDPWVRSPGEDHTQVNSLRRRVDEEVELEKGFLARRDMLVERFAYRASSNTLACLGS